MHGADVHGAECGLKDTRIYREMESVIAHVETDESSSIEPWEASLGNSSKSCISESGSLIEDHLAEEHENAVHIKEENISESAVYIKAENAFLKVENIYVKEEKNEEKDAENITIKEEKDV